MVEMKLPLLLVAMLASLLLVCALPPSATSLPRPSPCVIGAGLEWQGKGHLVVVEAMFLTPVMLVVAERILMSSKGGVNRPV